MNYVEFDSTVVNNNIILPSHLKNLENKKVKVRMQIFDNEILQNDKNESILAGWKEISQSNVFSEIDDSSEWQRKIRDEWK
jgi:hypothetical protein